MNGVPCSALGLISKTRSFAAVYTTSLGSHFTVSTILAWNVVALPTLTELNRWVVAAMVTASFTTMPSEM